MKEKYLYRVFGLFLGIGLLWQSCDVAYKYDIESGTDEYKGDASNVSIDTTLAIDVSLYDRARIFPGLVDTLTERRIADTTLILDLSKVAVSALDMGTKATPLPIYSTGLYAGAGELVVVYVADNTMGLTLQIGSHMDDLTSTGAVSREPLMYTTRTLFPGKNYVRNNLGGYIWIKKEAGMTGSNNFKLRIQNVYKAPDYVVGTGIDANDWANEIRKTTVPWLELRGEHVAFTVSKARVESKLLEDPAYAQNMETLLKNWDNIMETYYYAYYGLKAGNSDPKFRMPEFPERVVLDVQLINNVYMRWTGQPIVALNTNVMMNDLTDLTSLMNVNSTNVFTALGNNYLLTRSPWWSQMEAAAKVIPLYRLAEQGFRDGISERMNDIFTTQGQGINELFPLALTYASVDSAKWFRSDPGTNFDAFSLLPIIQLANYNNNNWAFFEHLHTKIKESPYGPSGLHYFFGELCSYFGKDFSPFFDHWGIDINDATRALGRQYPLLDKTIWQYDPLADNPKAHVVDYHPVDYRYRHIRSGWEVRSFDAHYVDNEQVDDAGAIALILDGQKSTRWHSWWRGGARPLPHYIVIDMKNRQQVDGFYYANGEREYRASRMIIETTDQENIRMDDINVVWRKIGELRPASDMQNYSAADGVKPYEGLMGRYRNERYFEFLNRQNIRYIRVVLPNRSTANSDLHTMAEFGTYFYK